MDQDEQSNCLLCGAPLAARQQECSQCKPLVSVHDTRPKQDLHYGIDVGGQGVGIGIALIIFGIAGFAALWIGGFVWPWALLVSALGLAILQRGLKERAVRAEARRRLQKRRAGKGRSRR